MDITSDIGHTFTISYMLHRAIHLPITLKSYLIRTSLNLDLELDQEASGAWTVHSPTQQNFSRQIHPDIV